jgi:cold shock protein
MRPEVVEEDGSSQPPSNFDSPQQPLEPQVEESSSPPVRGKVKWFNPGRRYGFVELLNGSGDAFLHISVLERARISTVQPGDTLELRVAPGQRNLTVTEILSLDSSTAALFPPRRRFQSPYDLPASEATVQEMGTVKWYNAARGFGFIARDGGGRDVFVHASVLQRAGITSLNEGQRVFIGMVEGRKGPEVGSIQLT